MGIYEFTDTNYEMFDFIVKPLIQTHTGLVYEDARSHYESKSIKMDLISRQISEATLIIADISRKNPNVFLELGIAYALKKPIIFLCSDNSYRKSWKRKMPFDTEGKELLIFKDSKDLKVKLGRFVSDCLYKTLSKTVSWISTNAKNHVKSSCELGFIESGEIWSSINVNRNFLLSYHVTIHEFDSKRNPDIRLFFSPTQNGYPRISIIFPWEGSEILDDKLECHIDFLRIKEPDENAKRLQQIPVCNIPKKNEYPKEFDVFVSLYYPNLVFESSLFDEKTDRLIIPIEEFEQLQFPIHFKQYIGFGSAHNVSISNIFLKEVFM
jgi:hypothetical protein